MRPRALILAHKILPLVTFVNITPMFHVRAAKQKEMRGMIYFLLGFLSDRYMAIENRNIEAMNDGIK